MTWIDELLRHSERIGQVRGCVLVTHLFRENDGWLGKGTGITPTLRRPKRPGCAVDRLARGLRRMSQFVDTLAMSQEPWDEWLTRSAHYHGSSSVK